jgi:hypothetical protein
MGDRLARLWGAVRPPWTARGADVTAMTAAGEGYAPPVRRRPGRDELDRTCVASGWHMRAGCSDGDGGTICPQCSQRVRTQRDTAVRHRVEVIEAHCA